MTDNGGMNMDELRTEESTTGGNIAFKMFIDPAEGFRTLSTTPVFIAVSLVVALCVMVLSIAIIETVGFERIVAEQINNSPQTADLPKEQRQEIIESQSSPVIKYVAFAGGGIATLVFVLLGGLYYWFAMNALGAKVRFPHGVAVFSYSSLPPTVLLVVSNLVVLALKPVDEIAALAGRNSGLVQANLSVLLGSDSSPALRALLESLDFFAIIGWILAALGIRIVGKVSTGTAVGIVALGALFGIAVRVAGSALFG